MQGWFKFHRVLLDKPIWLTSNPIQKTILITLLGMANHKENEWEFKGEKYTVKEGQFITSLDSIVTKCGEGVTMQNVRTALKRFEKYEFLTNQSTNKNRLITIVNWGFYQGSDDEANIQANKQLTSNQQATNKQLTTNKNVKNKENEKNKEIYIEQFEEFWSAYPNKKGKQESLNKFLKLCEAGTDPQAIIQGAKDYAKECELKGTEKKFIKHGSTFLNQKSFEDEFEVKQAASKQPQQGSMIPTKVFTLED